jgi:hypothetical protein
MKGGRTMRPVRVKLVSFGLALVAMAVMATAAFTAEVQRMGVDRLNELLGNPDLVIFDVRTGRDWADSGHKIKGALRMVPFDAQTWAKGLDKSQTYVLYCA